MSVTGTMRPGARPREHVGDGRWRDSPLVEAPRHAPAASHERQRAIGVDLSYSGRGDSAAVVVVEREAVDSTRDRYYVLAAWDGPRETRALRSTLAGYQAAHPDATMVSYIGGTELGVVQLFAEESRDPDTGARIPPVQIMPMIASASKVARAAGTIELWNLGRIILPREPWAERLARRAQSFTGRDGGHDDIIDALVAAVEFLRQCGGAVDLGRMTARRTAR